MNEDTLRAAIRTALSDCSTVDWYDIPLDGVDNMAMIAAKAALAAPTAKGGTEVPAGWKLVPKEPDQTMLSEGESAASVYIGKPTDDDAIPLLWRRMLDASPPPPAGAAGGGSGDLAVLSAACKPWEFCAGDPPDDDSPLHRVFVAGMLYSEKLLAGFLDVETYEPGDGSEDFDQDATKSLENILTAAGLYDPEEGRKATLAPTPDLGAQGEPVWVKKYKAECQRSGADFDAEACITENFPQIVTPQQPAAQGELVGREAVLAVVRAAWALVDNTGHHDLLPLAINRDDWNDLAARLAALKALLPAEELPADAPHAVVYFWPASSSIGTESTPDLGAQSVPVASEAQSAICLKEWRACSWPNCRDTCPNVTAPPYQSKTAAPTPSSGVETIRQDSEGATDE